MNIIRTSHVAFHCADVDKSIDFYRKVFGCKVKFDPDGNRFEIMEYTPESCQVAGRERPYR